MTLCLKLETKEREETNMKQIGKYNVDIYGDGVNEYEGYYMLAISKFNSNDKQVGKQRTYYIKCNDVNMFNDLTENEIDALYCLPNFSRRVSVNERKWL